MLKNFNPSKARPIDYVTIFRKHICETLRTPQDWSKVEPTFKRMTELRYSFNWDVITHSDSFNKPQMRVVQDNLEEYLRYCIFVSTKFQFGGKSGVKGFTSDWLMSWTQRKIQSDRMLFEISNILFNYAILNFNQAAIFLKDKHTKQEYKGALDKLRYAKWACKELIKINKELSKVMKVPFELRPDSLEFMLGLMEGLSYLCFFFMFEDGSNPAITGENLASLEREIAKWFYLCRESVKSNRDLKKLMKDIYPDLLNYYYNYNYNCLVRMIQIYGEKHQVEKTKGHIGVQYAYMMEAKALIDQAKRDDKFEDQKALKKRYEAELVKYTADTLEKIKQVYKCKIPKGDELNFIKPIQTKINGIEPKNIRIPPPDAPYFQNFRSEKIEGLRSSIQLFISNKKQHVEKTFYDLNEKMREIYTLNNIEALANCANLTNITDNEEFKTKLRVYKDVNGGSSGLQGLNNQIKQFSQQIDGKVNNIKQIIQNEQQKDQQMVQTTGNANAMTSFQNANQAELNQYNQMMEALRGYKSMEEQSNAMLQKSSQFINLFDQPNPDFSQFTNVSGMDAFIQANKEDLDNLGKHATVVNKIMNQFIKPSLDQILQILNGVDINKETEKIVMRERKQTEIFDDINLRFGDKFSDFEDKVKNFFFEILIFYRDFSSGKQKKFSKFFSKIFL